MKPGQVLLGIASFSLPIFLNQLGCLTAAAAESNGGQPVVLAGDRIPLGTGTLVVHPINHATLALGWDKLTILVDPVGGKGRFTGLPPADLILLTDIHGDHLNVDTLKVLVQPSTRIVAPPAVVSQLPPDMQARSLTLTNGTDAELLGIKIAATPAYNTSPERARFHSKGRGNGYILEMGGKRVYISGDTEDTPEMLGLRNIDVAFLCMNLPYTMSVDQAAKAVREFRPRIVYPYHCRGSDLQRFQNLVGTNAGVEVRIRDWYK